jgi:hypothetical protein
MSAHVVHAVGQGGYLGWTEVRSTSADADAWWENEALVTMRHWAGLSIVLAVAFLKFLVR